jgi:hypothetical protein
MDSGDIGQVGDLRLVTSTKVISTIRGNVYGGSDDNKGMYHIVV